MKKLTIEDFEKVSVGIGLPITYRYFTKDMRQVCLEPCLHGFCIGIYDDDEYLIGNKGCTNFGNDMGVGETHVFKFGTEVDDRALQEAVDIANKMLAVCQECNGNGEFINDSYDHRGEHIQSVDKCHKCNGTGTVQ